MSTTTPNLGLVKPAGTEKYSVAIVNSNSDTIDTAVKADRDRLTAVEGRATNLETRMTAAEVFAGGDTGWVGPLTLGAGYAVVSGYPLQVRRIGKQVWLHGMIQWNSGLLTAVVTTLAAQFRPPANRWLNLAQGTDPNRSKIAYLVQPGGEILTPSASYYEGTPAAGLTLALTGTWLVD